MRCYPRLSGVSLPSTRSYTSLFKSRCSIKVRALGLLASGPFKTISASLSFSSLQSVNRQVSSAHPCAWIHRFCWEEGIALAAKDLFIALCSVIEGHGWMHRGLVTNARYQDTSSDISLIYSERDLGFAAVIVKCQNSEVVSVNAQREIRFTEKIVGLFNVGGEVFGGVNSRKYRDAGALLPMWFLTETYISVESRNTFCAWCNDRFKPGLQAILSSGNTRVLIGFT